MQPAHSFLNLFLRIQRQLVVKSSPLDIAVELVLQGFPNPSFVILYKAVNDSLGGEIGAETCRSPLLTTRIDNRRVRLYVTCIFTIWTFTPILPHTTLSVRVI